MAGQSCLVVGFILLHCLEREYAGCQGFVEALSHTSSCGEPRETKLENPAILYGTLLRGARPLRMGTLLGGLVLLDG